MALIPTLQPYRFTVEEYLAFERASNERHEYLDGVIYAMAGESPDHGRICINLAATLVLQLRGSGCEAFSKDLQKRGFKFVGSTIIYAHMQATGMVNDHVVGCFRHKEVASG